jgi:hypothetical protein
MSIESAQDVVYNADDSVGEEVEPEHNLDLSAFEEEEQ